MPSAYHSTCQALAKHITYMVSSHTFNTSTRKVLLFLFYRWENLNLTQAWGLFATALPCIPSRGQWRSHKETKSRKWTAGKARLQLDKAIYLFTRDRINKDLNKTGEGFKINRFWRLWSDMVSKSLPSSEQKETFPCFRATREQSQTWEIITEWL